ncbi:aspartyl-phosphate phosphatase Spo0E family protein [Neobacillus cucumis]|nr:aspartyl-phosphate phosphatase Spo0E family protein [Neobacillus cucumis]
MPFKVAVEILRKKLVSMGMSNGLTSVETIKISQKLDYLINIQMGISKEQSPLSV